MHRLAPQRTLATTTAPSRYRRHARHHPTILCHNNKQPQSSPSSTNHHRRSSSPFGLGAGGGGTSRSSVGVAPFPHPEPPATEQPTNFGGRRDYSSSLSPSRRRLGTPFSTATTTVLPSPTSSDSDSSGTEHPQQFGGMGQRRHRRDVSQEIIVPPDDGSSSCPASELSTGALAANKAQSAEKQQPQKKTKTVAFGTVQIREYVMSLGDNPSCECGPPLSLSWEYAPHPRGDRDVMEYEKRRNKRAGTPKLRGTQLKLSPEARRAILRRLGESDERMERAAEEARKIRTDREESSSAEEDDSPKLVVGHPAHKLGELCSVSLTVMRKILYA